MSCSLLAVTGQSKEESDTLEIAKSEKTVELDEIVVSAQRNPVLQSELMRVVQVLSRKEIERSGAGGLDDLLSKIRGVDIRKRGSFGMQADVSIRGGTFDQILVLINGVNITDPQTGHHNLNIPVNLQSIQRIEVLQGPGARIFGPNAFSGAINIITRAPGNQPLQISLEGGEYAFADATLTLGGGSSRLLHFLSLNAARSDGFTQNTDFKNLNAYYRSSLITRRFDVETQVAFTQKEFGANSFYTPRFPDQFEEIHTGLLSLQLIPKGKINIKPLVYWRRQHDRFELFRYEAPQWYAGHNYHLTDVLGGSLNWLYPWKLGKSSVGIDYRYEQIYSTVLGDPLSAPRQTSAYTDVEYTHAFQRSGLSIMGEHNVYAGNFSFSSGILAYVNPELEKGLSLFPGLDGSWQFRENLRWFTSFSRTLRLPTFTDLFYNSPTNLGNANLQPEKAVSVETGIKGNHASLQFDAVIFRRWGKDMIDWVKQPGQDQWKSMNLTAVNFYGFEAGVWLPVPVVLNRTENELTLSLQYAMLEADKESGNLVSNYVLDYARHKVDGALGFSWGKNAGLHIKASWIDRAGQYMLYEDNAFTVIKDYSPYWTVDTRFSYRYKKVEAYSEINNLFNAHVVSIANVPQPGRWLRLGIKLELGM